MVKYTGKVLYWGKGMDGISVCVIARNEDNHIEECLKRLRPCKFEVIVVDTGSVDRTMELAAKYTDKVFQFEWCSDFSAARNYSIKKASNDWILVIDCDEYLENVNLLNVSKICKENPDKVGYISRNNPYIIQGVKSVMTERIGRFFNRNYCHYEGSIHERVLHLDGSEPETFELPLTIYHEGYVSESDKRTKATRNLEMLLHDLDENGENAYRYYQLGRNYVSLNDVRKAAAYYEKGLMMDVDPTDSFVQSMMESYGYCLLELEENEKELELIDKYYSSYSHRADFVYLAGMICVKRGLHERALEEFNKATTISVYNRNGVNSYRAYYQIASIYEKEGQTDKAMEMYSKCGEFGPAKQKLAELKGE